MAVAIDANVLIYACAPSSAKYNDCRHVILTMDDVRIPAMAIAEVLAFVRDAEREALQTLVPKLTVMPFDGRAVIRAASLIAKHSADGTVCALCLTPDDGTPCEVCGKPRSRGRKLGDFFVAASAAEDEDVTHLYTYDIRDALRRELAGSVVIAEPPDSNGPMFARASQAPQEAANEQAQAVTAQRPQSEEALPAHGAEVQGGVQAAEVGEQRVQPDQASSKA